jgi:sporulation protein YunB
MKMFGRQRWNRRRTLLLIVVVLSSFLLITFIFVDRNIKPIVIAMSESVARQMAVVAINDAVNEIMIDNYKYTDLINILQDNDGKISMLQANTIKMSELASKTALRAQEKINDVTAQGISLPIGSILGGQILAGQGPHIRIKIVRVGSVTTDFVTEFEKAGINQTRHKIFLRVNTQIRIVVPTGSEKIDVAAQIPISETIIVGNVPNSYVNVDETDKMLNLIPNDE